MNNNNNDVVYEVINERYRWSRYLNLQVIEDTTTGWYNATKMCALANKRFDVWWKAQHAKALMSALEVKIGKKATTLVKGAVEGHHIVSGTYVHPDLLPHIVSWCKNKERVLEGYVYVLNIFGHTDVYKVGCTTDLNARLTQFGNCILDPEFVYVSEKCSDCEKLETQVHEVLDQYRIRQNREFFRCSLHIIQEAIKECLHSINITSEYDK